MSELSKAADDIKSLAKKFGGFLEVAVVLERVGSLENYEKELQGRKEKSLKEAEEAEALLVSKKQDLVKADDYIKYVNEKAEEMLKSASERCAVLYSESNKKGDELIVEAQKKKMIVSSQIEEKQKELASVLVEISASKEELESIKKEVQEIKQSLAKFARS